MTEFDAALSSPEAQKLRAIQSDEEAEERAPQIALEYVKEFRRCHGRWPKDLEDLMRNPLPRVISVTICTP